jgi:FkbM family methyltransferase
MNLESFGFTERPTDVLSEQTRLRVLRVLSRRALPLFLRGSDYISAVPTVSGTWEPELVALLHTLARAGYNQALFDIGANIGLTTFLARDSFEKSYCFEPNPRVFHVLSANLYGDESQLFNFGLADRDAASTLTVPRKNFGGAFIRGSGNSYTDDEQSQKEALGSSFDLKDFDELPITVRRGRDVLAPLMNGLKAFVVKVDAEGFEQTILREVSASLPEQARVAIVFENLSPRFDARRFFAEVFSCSGKVLKLVSNLEGLTWLQKRLEFFRHGRRYSLSVNPSEWIGDIVYLIDGKVQ